MVFMLTAHSRGHGCQTMTLQEEVSQMLGMIVGKACLRRWYTSCVDKTPVDPKVNYYITLHQDFKVIFSTLKPKIL
jgi:hypothetical protein